MKNTLLTITAVALALAACGDAARDAPPADAFMAALTAHCGQAFAGRVAVDEPAAQDSPFAGQSLVMHISECGDDSVRIPFHVGEDRSRTWVLTRTATGIRLKHDHRHEDGSADAITMYGGDTTSAGTAVRQEFPVDDESSALFVEAGLAASTANVWAMEIEPGRRFVYELARPGTGRLFRVEFDLTTAVAEPPPPW